MSLAQAERQIEHTWILQDPDEIKKFYSTGPGLRDSAPCFHLSSARFFCPEQFRSWRHVPWMNYDGSMVFCNVLQRSWLERASYIQRCWKNTRFRASRDVRFRMKRGSRYIRYRLDLFRRPGALDQISAMAEIKMISACHCLAHVRTKSLNQWMNHSITGWYLVGGDWLPSIWHFPINIGLLIIPIDSYFSEGWPWPTNQIHPGDSAVFYRSSASAGVRRAPRRRRWRPRGQRS